MDLDGSSNQDEVRRGASIPKPCSGQRQRNASLQTSASRKKAWRRRLPKQKTELRGRIRRWEEIMPKGKDSLQYRLLQNAGLEQPMANSTKKSLKTDIKSFAAWCRANGWRDADKVMACPIECVQAYTDALIVQGRPPASIHRYVWAPCRALGIDMAAINKPRRTSGAISRGRRREQSLEDVKGLKRGDKEAKEDKYWRLVTLARATGLRRAELSRLRGRDLQLHDGHWSVHVLKGKGGKEQWQRVNPRLIGAAASIFGSVEAGEKVFKKNEMQNVINLHGYRAQNAKDMYAFYKKMIDSYPDLRSKYTADLRDYFSEMCPARNVGKWAEQLTDKPYLLRGENREKAISLGLPTSYDRTALMMVSVFHLSHWRLDVTVTNYLLT